MIDRMFLMAAMHHGGETMEVIGQHFGISRERVRQLLTARGVQLGTCAQIDLAAVGRVRERLDAWVPVPARRGLSHIMEEEGLEFLSTRRFLRELELWEELRVKAKRNYTYHRVNQLLRRYERIAAKLGRSPTAHELPQFTSYIQWFGGTSEAARLLGYPMRSSGDHLDPEHMHKLHKRRWAQQRTSEYVHEQVRETLDAYEAVVQRLGFTPTQRELGHPLDSWVRRWFSTANTVARLLGYPPNPGGRKRRKPLKFGTYVNLRKVVA